MESRDTKKCSVCGRPSVRLTTSQAGERTRFSFTVVMPIGDPKDRQATKIADLFLLGYGCTDVACGHVDFYREPGPEKPA